MEGAGVGRTAELQGRDVQELDHLTPPVELQAYQRNN